MLKKILILLSIFAIGSTSSVTRDDRNRHHNCHKHVHVHKHAKTITKYRHTVTKTVTEPCNTDSIGTGIMDEYTTVLPEETTTEVPEETTTEVPEETTTEVPEETTTEVPEETTTEVPEETTVEETTTEIPEEENTGDSDSVANCVKLFNKFRASQNLSPLQSAAQSEIDCADKAAANDARMGYHNSFYGRMCPSARAQCECMPGVNGGGLENCINAYISEGPPGTQGAYPEQNHGHYIVITGQYTHVACGTDGNGFYTHNFY